MQTCNDFSGDSTSRRITPSVSSGRARWWLPPTRKPLFWIGMWLVLACAIGLAVGSFNLPPLLAINQQPAQVEGRVTAKLPENHQLIGVEYVVDGTVYALRSSFVGAPNPNYGSVQVGDRVMVFYERTRPQNASLADPARRFRDEAAAVLVAALAIPTVIVFVNLLLSGGMRALGGAGRSREL